MDCRMLSLVALLGCFCFVASRPQDSTPALALKEGCREGQLFNCAGSVIAFFLSADGQRLVQLRDTPGKKQLEERDYNNLCRVGQSTVSCFDKWVDKCVPTEANGVHIVSKGTVKLFSTCNETGSYDKFVKLAQCSEKMNDTHKVCGEQMKEQHKDVNYKNPKVFLARDNLQKDVCCNLKKYNNCFLPKVQSTCGEEGKQLTDKVLQKVYESYQCTEATFNNCALSNTV